MSEIRENSSEVKDFSKNKSKKTSKGENNMKNSSLAEEYEEVYSDGGDFEEEENKNG